MDPYEKSSLPDGSVIIGNVALYGATSGEAYVRGSAGERFCVRNSGAVAVAEGCGDHGCEYMTGGRVVILGSVGKNFAAGMSGGVAYVLDADHSLYRRLNKDMVLMSDMEQDSDIAELKQIILQHAEATGSPAAKRILADFDSYIPLFKKIIPEDYQKITAAIAEAEKNGMTRSEAEYEAFRAVRG